MHSQPDSRELPAASILVVDDEEISRRAIIYSLEKAQLQSVNVESGEAAYKLLVEQPFDLVFLDVDMPGMTGFELCTKLRALPAHTISTSDERYALSAHDPSCQSVIEYEHGVGSGGSRFSLPWEHLAVIYRFRLSIR